MIVIIEDLHSHTYFSDCSATNPDELVKRAIENGIEILGISDHSYGITKQRGFFESCDKKLFEESCQKSINEYYTFLISLKNKYRDYIDIKCGIEIPTRNTPNILLPSSIDVSFFDYCLAEDINSDITTEKDIFKFAKRCGCPFVGIAHTDLVSFLKFKEIDKLNFFTKMAESNIFWELNVNKDSIHNFKEHSYVNNFFNDSETQDAIRKSGMKMSVGFDSHKVDEYGSERIKECCEKLCALDIKLLYE